MKKWLFIVLSVLCFAHDAFAQTEREERLLEKMLRSFQASPEDFAVQDSLLRFEIEFPIATAESIDYIVHNRLCYYVEAFEGILPEKIPEFIVRSDVLCSGKFSFTYYPEDLSGSFTYPVFFILEIDRMAGKAKAGIYLHYWICGSEERVILDNFPFRQSSDQTFEQKTSSYLQLLYLRAIMKNATINILMKE